MKVNKNIARLSLFALALALVSCNDFLNKYPDSRMDLKNPSEVSQLLVSAYPSAHPAYLTETFSDNTDEQLHSNWSAFDRFQEQAYNWKDIDEVRNAETPYQLWEAHYTAVATANEAIAHINEYGSHHTDSIITQNHAHGMRFLREVDSASVMINASTRFADGFEYGLGAEIGISTDKLHARGPVGLEGLTSQKYVVFGHGEIRT